MTIENAEGATLNLVWPDGRPVEAAEMPQGGFTVVEDAENNRAILITPKAFPQ